jgi:hypothetical protein
LQPLSPSIDSPVKIEAAGGEHKLKGEVVGYVDLQRRREERSRASSRHEGAPDPYFFSTLGFGLATPASWLSFFMFWSGSPLPVVAAPLMLPTVFVLLGVWQLWNRRSPDAKPPPGTEKQLLLALARSRRLTPVEAAIETSLTVDEAEEILARLASRGHLVVESRDGSLSYALPALHQESG